MAQGQAFCGRLKTPWVEAWAAGSAALALYLMTLQRSVSLPDSAVVMEAMQRPVISAFACNHTLNNLVGWLVCRLLPFGTLAWRCNAVSALYGAAVVGLFYALSRRLGASRLLATLCTATLAISHGLWWHATVVENYALSAVFFLACVHLLIGVTAETEAAARRQLRRLQNPLSSNVARASCPCFMGGTPMPRGVLQEPRVFMLFFLAGLALLNHLQNGLLLVGCAAALLGRRQMMSFWRAAASGAALGIAPYLAIVAWEILTGRAGDHPLAWFLGGGGFGALMFRHQSSGGILELARLLVWHHPGPFAGVAVLGLAWTLTRQAATQRPLWRLVWVVVAGNVLFFLGYATWDRFSFFLAPWLALDVAAVGWLANGEKRWPRAWRRTVLYPALALGVVAAPLFYTWQIRRLEQEGRAGWLTRNYATVVADYQERYDLAGMLLDPVRRDRGTIERFIRLALVALPPKAVWIDDGSTYDQVLWLQRREGIRPDVEVELLAHPAIPDRGSGAHALAMRRQWRGEGRRWFVVAKRGTAAEWIEHLRPFGWRPIDFPVGDGRQLYELVRSADPQRPDG